MLVMSVVALFFLLEEHRAHMLGVLPYLFLLACPLMHLFMHHGHHHGSEHSAPDQPKDSSRQDGE
ncbi:DUF2933 domain-containing protein [Agitococcus lubricus]|uniref:DUF2933 family protein n=1 Tax=Agitococcus lubricus TaxID=1077255 RepID=A0A2T5IX72_9GAMM|nr:Protein of unknown function (DUF2933) [Agitococcus lubricus]